MKTIQLLCLGAAAFTLTGQLAQAASLGTGFTYQGRLFIGDVPANGLYDLQFTNYDLAAGGSALGGFNTNALPVTNGLFTVTLDFGAVFDGTPRWLEISERTNNVGAFGTLAPRQLLAAAPYATYAASAGSVPGLTILQNADGAPNVIGGSTENWVASGVVGATIGGGGATSYNGNAFTNSVSANFGTIGGGSVNTIQTMALWATIGGGIGNTIQTNAQVATIGGGLGNTIQTIALAATIGGGYLNTIQTSAQYATIGGGYQNKIQPDNLSATIGGGAANTNYSWYATIGGGEHNVIQPSADHATIGGGSGNKIQPNAYEATIGGGYGNTIQTNAYEATIGGGNMNMIRPNAYEATIGGGDGNTIQIDASDATIGGGSENTIQTNAQYATIGGGETNTIQPYTWGATIGGGIGNTIQTNAYSATISGGYVNWIQTNALYATIGGGINNMIQPIANGATIGGGDDNTIQTNDQYATIGGGEENMIQNDTQDATIGGGDNNTIQTQAWGATIGGGEDNKIQTDAGDTTIGGGFQNTILPITYGATIGGGDNNTIQTYGYYATIPGGNQNFATSYAFAAGNQAKAIHTGAFVWADSTAADFSSTANNQFAARANGGVFFQLGGANVTVQADDTSGFEYAKQLVIQGNTKPSRQLELGYKTDDSANYGSIQTLDGTMGGGDLVLQPIGGWVGINTVPGTPLDVKGTVRATTFITSSDRNLKEHLSAVNPREVLDQVAGLSISRWNFKGDDRTPHVGPMAQDFYAAFHVGTDDKHIATVDADGVALAAIQGLNQKLEETRADNAALRADNADLRARLEKLERLLQPSN